jgi:hypothetical protein
MTSKFFQRQAEAAQEFNRHENRDDGQRVVSSLDAGLSMMRELFYERMHRDVEEIVGADSMLVPLSEMKTQKATKSEIELFQVAESAVAVRQRQYVASDDDWYPQWLAKLRLSESATVEAGLRRIRSYQAANPDERRLALVNAMLEVLPESRKAPLVLFRLVPLSVHLATALAFEDRHTAGEVRNQQKALLPAISDCHKCHGAVLENGDVCSVCGNPVWRFAWLTVTD